MNDCYTCGGNALWVDMSSPNARGAPITRAAIQQIQPHVLQEPGSRLPVTVTIAVDASSTPMAHKGRMQLVSPEEPIAALILRIAADIDAGASEEALKLWKRSILTASVALERLESFQDWRGNIALGSSAPGPTQIQIQTHPLRRGLPPGWQPSLPPGRGMAARQPPVAHPTLPRTYTSAKRTCGKPSPRCMIP